MALELRHPGTGVWYTNSIGFREWLTGEKGKLWLHGIRKSYEGAFVYCKEIAHTNKFNLIVSHPQFGNEIVNIFMKST